MQSERSFSIFIFCRQSPASVTFELFLWDFPASDQYPCCPAEGRATVLTSLFPPAVITEPPLQGSENEPTHHSIREKRPSPNTQNASSNRTFRHLTIINSDSFRDKVALVTQTKDLPFRITFNTQQVVASYFLLLLLINLHLFLMEFIGCCNFMLLFFP